MKPDRSQHVPLSLSLSFSKDREKKRDVSFTTQTWIEAGRSKRGSDFLIASSRFASHSFAAWLTARVGVVLVLDSAASIYRASTTLGSTSNNIGN